MRSSSCFLKWVKFSTNKGCIKLLHGDIHVFNIVIVVLYHLKSNKVDLFNSTKKIAMESWLCTLNNTPNPTTQTKDQKISYLL